MKSNTKALIILMLITSFFYYSCDEFVKEEFYETQNLSDSMWIDGTIAVPILDTKLALENLIPKTDSSLWAEVDENQLVHLRSYFKDLVVLQGSNIYDEFPYSEGTVIEKDSFVVQTDTSKVKVYDQALSGHLFFNNPKFTFKFKNEIPIVTYFRLDTITFLNIAGQMDSISHTSHTNYNISAPTSQGNIAETEIVIDKSVIPEFPEIFSPIPKKVAFCITVGNPTNQTVPWDLTGEEKISLDVDIDLPLDARLDEFVLGDTIPFDMGGDNYEFVESVELRIQIENGFPFEALSQLTFVDSLSTFTENVFEDGGWIFAAGEIDSEGKVIAPTLSRLTVIVNQEKFKRLKDNEVKYLVYTSNLNTEDADLGQYIKIYSYYQMGVKIGLKADYGFNLGDTTLVEN